MASSIPNKLPKVSEMVLIAIAMLNDRNGSSMRAIKKYITSSFNVEPKKLNWNIKKYLIMAVESGTLVRTKGKGAAGSFRLGGAMKLKMSELIAKVPSEKLPESSDNKPKSTSSKSTKKGKPSGSVKSKDT